ncbi:proteasome regulatory particle subunit [Fusarium falciforme]|uniref:Proteasome regulatory particle subunit n=1 Tax=Fusarium falciforme TaxID=195108 RepID=A0A9W8V0Z9_9HYPO|nr:PCI domain-containing protein [Fusarium falciforme]KAJ4133341.1 proteasome regulatory particle subunit [Fusarium falciforme]KAJ4190105.1 proteasome regulatory particle subunit [Fusarium falciforme]KAJ4202672.1 proteasome regulatory particle subunit [Fusarium falciforme]KAJ4253737.1 proteasome regulatory particle subunit [Fusarium falciforme]WAO86562.1 PCI domain-containing protein [Fusarium falciforme]
MGSDPQYAKWPLLPLSQHVFTLTNAYASKTAQQAAVKALQDAIAQDKMAPFYRYLAHPLDGVLNTIGEGGASAPGRPLSRKSSLVGMVATKPAATVISLPWDEGLYNQLKEDNDRELQEFQKEEDEAVEQAGDTEIMAAKGKRAEFWARVGDKDKAIAAYESVFEKTGILGTKIDLVLAIIRMGLFYGDKPLVKKHVERAKSLVETGGDWDRRNRLKAYEGLHLLTVRSYNLAAPLLLDSLSTFTSYELCTYSNLVVYSVLAGSVSLKRVDFKSKVVDAPEIKAILGDGEDKLLALSGALSAGPGADDTTGVKAPKAATTTAVNLTTLGTSTDQPEAELAIDFSPLALLVSSLYNGNYKTFFRSLAEVEEQFLNQDRYLHEHKSWFIREMRLRAYQQLLQSYRVVGLESMANDFGVTVDFLDRDLARFIAAGRIPCTIDRVTGKGVIETNRPDDKNKQYQDVVRQGDQLITKLQKYGQAVRLRGSERA